jgi:putative tryptophan/tyrosine transport system substrate-binding protein
MNRREFIGLLGGMTASMPLVARAQQSERLRRIGMLMVAAAGDPEFSRRLAALQGELGRLGWIEGRNIRFETRWAAGDPDRIRNAANELISLSPDVILANGSSAMDAIQRATRTVPVVFVVVPDPVGAGYADSLSRPGGNATGFSQFEFGIGGKWLELLKELAPGLKHAGIIRDPTITAGPGQFGAIQSMASSLGIEVTPLNVRDAAEIERAITAFSRKENGGLIVTGSALAVVHRKLIIGLAAKHKLPAIYFADYTVRDGGLASYGPDLVDQYRQAASYVDRILKGEKPGDLPVQAPIKYDTVINLKTAKALGINVPPALLARADEVIE